MKNLFCFLFIVSSFGVLSQDGTYDLSFGDNGTTITDLPGGAEMSLLVAENADGSLWVHAITSLTSTRDKVLVRYTSTGNLDVAFGVNGVVALPLDGEYHALNALPDGSMLIAGSFNENFIVLKYLSDGTLDTSFGDNGVTTIDLANEISVSLFIEEDGSITIVGRFRDASEEGVLIASLLPNGILNPDFGINGIAITVLTEGGLLFTYQISRYPDGSFLVPFQTEDASKNRTIGFAKIQDNGTLDSSFGDNGIALTQITTQTFVVVSAIIQDNEKILSFIHIQGMNPPAESESYFIQLLADGTLDSNYGNNGIRDFPNNTFSPIKAIKQENNRILFQGSEYSIDGGSYTIMRTFMSGFIDTSFANQGRFFELDLNPGEAIITEDGGIVGSAFTPFFNGPQTLVLLKLLNTPLQIEENTFNDFTVFPNPTADIVTISCPSCNLLGTSYTVTDTLGKIVLEGVFETETPSINMSDFSTGVYLLRVEETTIKLLKN